MTSQQPQENPTPRFALKIPLDKAHEAARALKKIGIDFVPARDMQLLGYTDSYNDELNGEDAANVREKMNEYLSDNDIRPLVPKGKLTLPQIYELLHLAQSNLSWKNFGCVTELYPEDQTWQEIIGAHPALFPKNAPKP